jgi:arabinofuranosyltransferase
MFKLKPEDLAPPVLDPNVFLRACVLGLFILVLVRTAWMCDDAYITLRTVDNLVSGFGPRWNVSERVQAYTHPLWMLALALPYYFTREAYFTPLVLSMLISVAAMWLFVSRLALSGGAAIVGASVFIFSKAFVEYSTSGLENPLTHFLLAIFFVLYWHPERAHRVTHLWLAASLIMLNRLDAGLLVLPALLVRTYRMGWQSGAKAVASGLLPLLIWEMFSIAYYGFPFPNTAYAKLNTGIPSGALAMQGLLYLMNSLTNDPVTLFAIVVFVTASLATRQRENWPIALGILLYLVYVVRVGGDFMSGRFLTAPLFCAVALISRFELPLASPLTPAATATIIALGLFATARPPLTSQDDAMNPPPRAIGIAGVTDERAFYYRYTGLLRWTRDVPLPHFQWETEGREARANPGVFVRAQIGLFGYFAGPGVHVVDVLALADPLLARLPAQPKWRIGHFERRVPQGYVETLQDGRNVIVDADTAMKYERLKVVTREPIWSRRRWRAIAAVNMNR